MQFSKNPIQILFWGEGGRCPRALLFMTMAKFSSKVIYITEFPLPLALPKATNLL